MFFFREVIDLLTKHKIYPYIEYRELAGSQLKKSAAGLSLVFIAVLRPLHLDFSISKIQMVGTYGEVCTKKSIYQRKR